MASCSINLVCYCLGETIILFQERSTLVEEKDPTKYRRKLVNYMYWKQARLSELKIKPLYFTQKDAQFIWAWSEQIAEQVWEEIERCIKHDTCSNFGNVMLASKYCPFCIYHRTRCSRCKYASVHGKCGGQGNGSDYARIVLIVSVSINTASKSLNTLAFIEDNRKVI